MDNFPQHLLEFMKSHFHNCGTNKAGIDKFSHLFAKGVMQNGKDNES